MLLLVNAVGRDSAGVELCPPGHLGESWESASRVANRNGDGTSEILEPFWVVQYVF